MDFNGAFSSITGKKVDQYVPWKLTCEFGINCGFYKESTNQVFVRLLVSIVFNDPSRMKNTFIGLTN